jgi:acyl-CoA oxidase
MAAGFGVDLLMGRVAVPESHDTQSLLARHADGLLQDVRARASRSQANAMADVVLPQCVRIVEAVGHRMAFDAAVAAGVAQPLVDLFVASAMHADPAWYAEHGITSEEHARIEREAVAAAGPHLDVYLAAMDLERHITAPIVSQERWDAYEETLPVFQHDESHVSPELYVMSKL